MATRISIGATRAAPADALGAPAYCRWALTGAGSWSPFSRRRWAEGRRPSPGPASTVRAHATTCVFKMSTHRERAGCFSEAGDILQISVLLSRQRAAVGVLATAQECVDRLGRRQLGGSSLRRGASDARSVPTGHPAGAEVLEHEGAARRLPLGVDRRRRHHTKDKCTSRAQWREQLCQGEEIRRTNQLDPISRQGGKT